MIRGLERISSLSVVTATKGNPLSLPRARGFFLLFLFLLGGCTPLSEKNEKEEEKEEDPPASSSSVEDQTTRAGRPRFTVRASSIPILPTVLRPSDYYTIDPIVLVDGYYYVFTIRLRRDPEKKGRSSKDEETFQAVSVRGLIKLCHEIEVVERYRAEKGSEFLKGVGESVTTIGRGLGNIFLHPGQTLKAIGTGVNRCLDFTASLAAAPFRSSQESRSRGAIDRGLPGKGPAGAERRRAAYELGVDVYTENPMVQQVLNSIARKRLAAKLPLHTAVLAMPGGIAFTLALTPVGFDPGTEELIRDFAPEDLSLELARRFHEQLGLPIGKGSAVQKLLDNPHYSPRELAYLWRYMLDMRYVEEMETAIAFLSRAASPPHAAILTTQVELLSLLHQRARPLHRFIPVRSTLGARAMNGSLCFVISIDTVRYWSDVEVSLRAALDAAAANDANPVEIWSTGDIDEASLARAKEYGIVVHQNILEQEIFRRPREEMEEPIPSSSSSESKESTNLAEPVLPPDLSVP